MGPAIPLLRDDQGISRALSALHGTALAAGTLVAGAFGARLVARVGRDRALWGGLLVVCGGAIAFCSSTVLPVTWLAALVCGFGGSMVVITTTALLSDHHRASAAAAISEANAFAAGFGVAAPLALGSAERWGPGWRAGLLLYLVLVAALALVLGRVRVPDHRTWSGYDAGRAVGALPAAYWRAWAVVTACVAVEFCLTIWASDVLRSRYHLSPGAAAAGVTAVVGGMAAGRAFGGRISQGRDVDRLLYAVLALCAAGFAVFWTAPTSAVALAGLALTGLGVSLQFPLAITRAIARSGGLPDLANARASLGVGAAVGVGPFVLGALADHVGPHPASLVVPVLLVLAAVGVRAGARDRIVATPGRTG